jgi:oligopeptide transport system ATP-binding protein
MSTAGEPLIRANALVKVEDLKMHFAFKGGLFARSRKVLRAVDGVSLEIQRGETLGLVGESGCGKSTLGRCILRLYRPTSGRVIFEGTDLTNLNEAQLQPLRRRMQLIFQDPYSALNPRLTVADTLCEPLAVHRLATNREQQEERVQELLRLVGLPPDAANRYPFQFSGGQCQRIVVARAIALLPTFVVCDEPLAALDVSIQAQIVNLLKRLQRELNLTYLFISHDLRMVRLVCDRVAVMYLGKIVEMADRDAIYQRRLHPYTRALLSAVPVPDPKAERSRRRIILSGDVPSPVDPPSGCRFHPRCQWAQEICSREEPTLQAAAATHEVACHFWQEIEHKISAADA